MDLALNNLHRLIGHKNLTNHKMWKYIPSIIFSLKKLSFFFLYFLYNKTKLFTWYLLLFISYLVSNTFYTLPFTFYIFTFLFIHSLQIIGPLREKKYKISPW